MLSFVRSPVDQALRVSLGAFVGLTLVLGAAAHAHGAAFVQMTPFNSGSPLGQADAGVDGTNLGFGASVHPGDLIVVGLGHTSSSVVTITDDRNDLYVLVPLAVNPMGAASLGSYVSEIWYAVVGDGGSGSLDVTYSATNHGLLDIVQTEYSGLRVQDPVGGTSYARSSTSSAMDGGTVTTHVPGELVFTWDNATGFVRDAGPEALERRASVYSLVQERISDTVGPYIPVATTDSSEWIMETATFIPAEFPDGGLVGLDGGIADGGTVDPGNGDDAGTTGGGHRDAGEGVPSTDAGVVVDGPDGGLRQSLDANLGCGCSQSSLPVSTLALLALAFLRGRGRRLVATGRGGEPR